MLQEPDQSQKLRLIKLQRGVNRILSTRYAVYERGAGSESTPGVLGACGQEKAKRSSTPKGQQAALYF